MAKWLDCLPENVQNIESGRVKLTWDRATLLCNQTTANIGWLMKGNPANPTDWYHNPYTPEAFRTRQGEQNWKKKYRGLAAMELQVVFAKAVAVLAATLLRAYQEGKEEVVSVQVVDALKSCFLKLDETGIDRNGLLSRFIEDGHTITRPNLTLILDTWEAHFEDMLERLPQPKTKPAKPAAKTAKRKAGR